MARLTFPGVGEGITLVPGVWGRLVTVPHQIAQIRGFPVIMRLTLLSGGRLFALTPIRQLPTATTTARVIRKTQRVMPQTPPPFPTLVRVLREKPFELMFEPVMPEATSSPLANMSLPQQFALPTCSRLEYNYRSAVPSSQSPVPSFTYLRLPP
jgi:hypothetical protein